MPGSPHLAIPGPVLAHPSLAVGDAPARSGLKSPPFEDENLITCVCPRRGTCQDPAVMQMPESYNSGALCTNPGRARSFRVCSSAVDLLII